MEIAQYGLYRVSDIYFNDFESKYFCDNKNENRPHCCAFKESNGTIWLIPLSTRTSNYRDKIDKDEKRSKDGKCLFYHIGTIAGEEKVFLIGNMFPVSNKYIKSEYTISGIHYVIKEEKTDKRSTYESCKVLSTCKTRKIASSY